jgi:hypothetical protein
MDQGSLLRAAQAAEQAGAAQSPEDERRAVMAVMREREAIQIGLMYARLRRMSDTPHAQQRRPLMEDGDVIGVVEARIPKELFFRLGRQENFGFDGFYSDEGMKDVLKAHPFCKVKTVSDKITVPVNGLGGRSERRSRCAFGRGTLNLAT